VAVFTNAALPLTFTDIKASQRDKAIQVYWTVINESNIIKYRVERSSDARHFIMQQECCKEKQQRTKLLLVNLMKLARFTIRQGRVLS
jgi:hypothetical protein